MLADQVEAIRALLQSLRAVRVLGRLGSPNVYCDRLSQTVGKRRACERWEARSRSERKRERVRRAWRCDAVAVMRDAGERGGAYGERGLAPYGRDASDVPRVQGLVECKRVVEGTLHSANIW